jgi:uncharacterized Zn-binding protein involved in type VI secretion
MAAAARELDLCSCPEHGIGIILSPGVADVIICHQPVVRKGDRVLCITGDVATIVEGCSEVIIGGHPVARKGDHTSHGGIILTGCPRVFICESRKLRCTKIAAAKRSPFIKHVSATRVRQRRPRGPVPTDQ